MNANFEKLFAGRRPLSLRALRLPPALKVLVLAPHPDDFDAIGITMRLLKENGNAIYLGVAHTGSGVQDSYCSPPTRETTAAIREQEQRRSCRFFGLPEGRLTFLHFEEDEDQQPTASQKNLEHLRAYVLSIQPDLVLMPHGNDTNTGHQKMYGMFRQIASQADRPLAVFLNRDPKTIEMRIDLYSEFGENEAKWKAELLRYHDSQQQRNLNTRGHGFDQRILSVNRQIPREISVDSEYAEAFELELYGPGSETSNRRAF
jgi:LmbE family N-acetylglucosaminyl deacetylase